MKVVDRKHLPMFGVDEALERILESGRDMAVEEIPLAAVEGRYLAREIRASSDMPPFDRTAMDGYAVRSDDVASVPVDLEVIEEIPAGRPPSPWVPTPS
jgi:molybdopterin molybdotransferase